MNHSRATDKDQQAANFASMLNGVQLPFDPALVIPALTKVSLPTPTTTAIVDVRAAAANEIVRAFATTIKYGDTVAVGAGSRGLTARVEMLAGVIDGFRSIGAEP